jgi:hypothetical protein
MMAKKMTLLLVLFVFLFVLGCIPQTAPPPTPTATIMDPGIPSVVIQSPPSESTFPAQSRVLIHSSAQDETVGINRVELSVNGALVRSDKTPEDTPQNQYSLLQAWVPEQPGEYILTVVAYRSDGTASSPAKINLIASEPEAVLVEEGQPCMVLASTRINIRNGPGTTFSILDILPLGEIVPVNGRNDDYSWWQIEFNTTLGWVFAELTYPEGDCDEVEIVDASPEPAPKATDAGQQVEQTVAAPLQTPETAPEDTEYNVTLLIPVNLAASVSDHVSYPDGDRVDKVKYDVSGLNSGDKAQLLITAVCSGIGMEHVSFSTGGQTFGCSQPIISREVSTDNKSGTIIIEATGGVNTNVFWVLTGTVTVIPPLPMP